MNKGKIITTVLSVLTIVFATASWWSARSAVVVADSSTWAVPMFLFSVYIILVCLDSMLFREVLLLELVLIGSLATSLLITPELLQLAGILISSFFLFVSTRKIRRDMELSLKISPWKSLQAGKVYLLIAFIFLIAVQYFLTIRSFDGEKKVPHFDTSYITKKIAIPFLASVNPQYKALKDENLTVDQFFTMQMQSSLQSDADQSSFNEQLIEAQLPANMTPQQKEAIKKQAMEQFSNTSSQVSKKNQELILATGRKQLSDFVGVPVSGDEKISEVLTGPINAKINDYFNAKISSGDEKNSMLPLVFALVLALIVYPVGLLLSVVWFMAAWLVLTLFLRFKVFGVKTINVSKEVLE